VTRIIRDRRVWIPSLVVWLAFGVLLTAWVGNLAYVQVAAATRSVVPVQTGARLPADMPSDFPIYPNARLVGSFRGGASPSLRGVQWVTTDPPNQVYDYYRITLKQSPWRVFAAVSYPVPTISFEHERNPLLSCSVAIGKSKSGQTLIIFQYAPV
jgi:hypothetical protein